MAPEQLYAIVDQLPALVWTTDRYDRITFAAGAGWRELALEPSTCVGKLDLELFARLHDGTVMDDARRRLRHGEPAELEFELAGRVFEATIRPLSVGGSASGSIGVALDITDRRRLEERLQASQRLEALGRLAGGIAHDFNNIITLVDGYASLALDELDSVHPARADLQVIREAAERAARLVSQLLAFSTRKAGASDVVRLDELVTGLEGILRRVVGKQPQLEIRVVDVRSVRGDAAELEQIVIDLVLAARDATSAGRLVVEVFEERVDLSSDRGSLPSGEYVGLRVACEGQSRTTGFGLAIIRGVVAQLGGQVFVRNEPGHGTAVEVLLPAIEDGVSTGLLEEPEEPSTRRRQTILVVEDDPPLREAMLRILEPHGYRIHLAEEAESARAMGDEIDALDLVICDIVVPGHDDTDIVTSLRARHPALLAVYVAGHSIDAVQELATSVDARHVLSKPFTADALLAKIRSVLDANEP